MLVLYQAAAVAVAAVHNFVFSPTASRTLDLKYRESAAESGLVGVTSARQQSLEIVWLWEEG